MARRDLNLEDEKRSYAGLWLLCAALLVVGSIWALLDDTTLRRPWKQFQNEFFALEKGRQVDALEAEEASLGGNETFQDLQNKLTQAQDSLRDPETAAKLAALEAQLPMSLMHMSDEPDRMQEVTQYCDVVNDVKAFLGERVAACIDAGIDRNQMLIDPGFGFGKTVAQNYDMLRRLGELASFELPILVGVSRKSMIGAITGRPASERLVPSAVLAVLAVARGASIVRVHDVAETADALAVWRATRGEV